MKYSEIKRKWKYRERTVYDLGLSHIETVLISAG